MLVFAPQPSYHFHQQSPRQRYLQALLAEQQAARKAYARDILDQYSSPYDNYSYADEREARIREHYRQQQVAAARAAHLHQQQEEQRRRHMHEQQRLAHLERDNSFAQMLGQLFQRPQQHDVSEPVGLESHCLPQVHQESQPTRPATTWQQKQAAASAIQSFYRKHLAQKQVRRIAFSQLAALRRSFISTKTSFTFPSNPEFDLDQTSPRLLYTAYNAPIHSFEDSLVKLLSRLDEVESAGDVEIRKARKSLAREIEGCLEGVDRMKEGARRTQQEASVLAALPDIESEMDDVVAASESGPVVPEVIQTAHHEDHHPAESTSVDKSTTTVNSLDIEDAPAPLADMEMEPQKDYVAASDTPKSEASSSAPMVSSNATTSSDPAPETTMVEQPKSLSALSTAGDPSSLLPSSSLETHEVNENSHSSPNDTSSSASSSSSPRMDDTFLSQPFDAPGSQSVLMASLPVLNDDVEQREVEDIVFVDAEPSSGGRHSLDDAEHQDTSTESDADDFVMVL